MMQTFASVINILSPSRPSQRKVFPAAAVNNSKVNPPLNNKKTAVEWRRLYMLSTKTFHPSLFVRCLLTVGGGSSISERSTPIQKAY
jgi:hypothetical protein